MTIGFIGLGKMGFPLALSMMGKKMTVVAFDHDDTMRKKSAEAGIVTTSSIQAVAMHLPSPRIVWNMARAGSTTSSVLAKLLELLSPGDIVIDGSKGSSANSQANLDRFKKNGISFLSCEIGSGGENTAGIMIRGNKEAYEFCKPMFDKIFGENESQFIG